MNKQAIEKAFTKNLNSYNTQAEIQKSVAARVALLTRKYLPETVHSLLEIGCGTGFLTKELIQTVDANEIFINDLSVSMCENTATECNIPEQNKWIGDFEELPIARQFDVVTSSSVLQWFTHLDVSLHKISELLTTNGLFVFSTYGDKHMHELYDSTSNRFLQLRSRETWCSLLEKDFSILKSDESEQLLYFPDFKSILVHLKQTGVNGCSNGRVINSPSALRRVEATYKEKHEFCGQLPLTYHPLFFVCQKK